MSDFPQLYITEKVFTHIFYLPFGFLVVNNVNFLVNFSSNQLFILYMTKEFNFINVLVKFLSYQSNNRDDETIYGIIRSNTTHIEPMSFDPKKVGVQIS